MMNIELIIYFFSYLNILLQGHGGLTLGHRISLHVQTQRFRIP